MDYPRLYQLVMKSFPEHCPSQESSPNSNGQQDKQLDCHEFSLPVMERETGLEPATNSLESYDSTAELLPLSDEWLVPFI